MTDYRPASDLARSPLIRVVDVYVYRFLHIDVQFLLLRRSVGKRYAGDWRMVGGKIRPHERAWETARRELDEETGMTVSRFWALPSANVFYEWQTDRVNIAPAFAAEVDSDAPVLDDEHDAWVWLSVDETVSRLVWPEQRRLVRLVADLVGSPLPEEWLIPDRMD